MLWPQIYLLSLRRIFCKLRLCFLFKLLMLVSFTSVTTFIISSTITLTHSIVFNAYCLVINYKHLKIKCMKPKMILKSVLLAACICLFFSCKKDTVEFITTLRGAEINMGNGKANSFFTINSAGTPRKLGWN